MVWRYPEKPYHQHQEKKSGRISRCFFVIFHGFPHRFSPQNSRSHLRLRVIRPLEEDWVGRHQAVQSFSLQGHHGRWRWDVRCWCWEFLGHWLRSFLDENGWNKTWLVVEPYPSEKWWTSSVGMMTFPIYGKIKMFQSTNQNKTWLKWWFLVGKWFLYLHHLDPEPVGSSLHACCTARR